MSSLYVVIDADDHQTIYDSLAMAKSHSIRKSSKRIINVGSGYIDRHFGPMDTRLYTDRRNQKPPIPADKQREGVEQIANHKRKRRITRNHERTKT